MTFTTRIEAEIASMLQEASEPDFENLVLEKNRSAARNRHHQMMAPSHTRRKNLRKSRVALGETCWNGKINKIYRKAGDGDLRKQKHSTAKRLLASNQAELEYRGEVIV